MRLYYPNLVDDYSAITGSSRASSDLSYENVAHEHVSKVWRTGATLADEYVTFDLGSSQAATAAIIFAHDLESADASAGVIEVRKSTDNFAANDVLVGSFTFSAAAMVLTFASTSSRYWRIKFTKFDAAEVRQIGRVFLGNYVTFTGLPDFDGFEVQAKDMSQSERSEGGQVYTAQRDQYRVFKLTMSGLTQAQGTALKLFSETVGTHTAFFMIADESAPSDESGETVYCKAADLPARKSGGLDTAGALAWEGTLTANELL